MHSMNLAPTPHSDAATGDLFRELNRLAEELRAAGFRAREAEQTSQSLLGLLADIRAAAGDPEGKLMQDELVAHIARQTATAKLGDITLSRAKRLVASGCTEDWYEDVLMDAAALGVSNVQRVAYDPAKHGEADTGPGQRIWWWSPEATT